MAPAYLPNETIYLLTDAALSAGLTTPDARDDLLMGISAGYAASLPSRNNPLDQIRSDLVEMNRVPYLIGNEVPLQLWLENAVQRLRRTRRPEQSVFQTALERVAAQALEVMAQARNLPPRAVTGGVERIVHEDDLLPYGWLRGAVAVGTAVARVTVPRFENGIKKLRPGSDSPVQDMGTAWLIGPQHVMTNHHVVDARSLGEPIAAESDLRKQVESASIQFDYDVENANGTTIVGASLEAWAPRDATPALDFAVLKLPEPSPRTPLTLAPTSVTEYAKGPGPVNIVQHPGGAPKMLGVRNNLVSALDDFALSYYTDTMQGSSGSPVCNDRWHAVALHRAWEYTSTKLVFQGKETAWRNVGVRLDRIIEHIQQNHAGLWEEIRAHVV